jgi:hypothetical protein
MGLLDKFKSAIDTATDVINKSIEASQNAKDPLADPMVKKYYDVTYGLLKTIRLASYDVIKKYIEYQLKEPCDEAVLQNALECFWGSPLYHIITENTFSEEKQNKIEEANRILDTLNLYRCTEEEVYGICFEKEIQEITSEFENVIRVVDEYGFKHVKEGMRRIYENHHKELGLHTYHGIVHLVVKKKFFEDNSTTRRILITALDHATYKYQEINGSSRVAAIALRALNFNSFNGSEEDYVAITKADCLEFVSNNEEFIAKAKQLKADDPFDTTNHIESFAEKIPNIDVMSGTYSEGKFAETECWMPDCESEAYYADKVCYCYWKYIVEKCGNTSTEANDVYDMIWDCINSED